jgi:hypothetical protein
VFWQHGVLVSPLLLFEWRISRGFRFSGVQAETLDWVSPKDDLAMEYCPADPHVWDIPIQEIRAIDLYTSPKDKLVCLTNALKWCVKTLEYGLGHSPGMFFVWWKFASFSSSHKLGPL